MKQYIITNHSGKSRTYKRLQKIIKLLTINSPKVNFNKVSQDKILKLSIKRLRNRLELTLNNAFSIIYQKGKPPQEITSKIISIINSVVQADISSIN